jgi:hypothetical protein
MSNETRDVVEEDEPARFVLDHPLKYHTRSGDQEEASWIELHPPTPRHAREVAFLEQAFLRAARSQESKDDDDPNDDGAKVEGDAQGPNPIGVVAVLAMSNEDFPGVLEVAKKHFASGVAMVEGETKLTNKLIESMSLKDFERMLGVYLVNFTLASSLAQPRTSTPR